MPHKGIVTAKCEKANIVNIKFIHVNTDGVVELNKDEIDLAKTNVYQCRFDLLDIPTKEQILEKTELKQGKKLCTTEFLKHCLLRYPIDQDNLLAHQDNDNHKAIYLK